VGVANVLARNADGQIVAYNTDAMALGAELRHAVDHSPADPKRAPYAMVIGSGGAALASVVGCRLAGIAHVAVTARRFDPRVDSSAWPRAREFKNLGAELVPWFVEGGQASVDFLTQTHLLIQATSAGMKGTQGGEELADVIPWAALSSAVAYDLVYTPPETPFLSRAKREGHAAVGGLGMLVGQAAHAIQIWWGESPAPAELMGTARKALGL
jgi:shikimate dehydrogenase